METTLLVQANEALRAIPKHVAVLGDVFLNYELAKKPLVVSKWARNFSHRQLISFDLLVLQRQRDRALVCQRYARQSNVPAGRGADAREQRRRGVRGDRLDFGNGRQLLA